METAEHLEEQIKICTGIGKKRKEAFEKLSRTVKKKKQ